MLLLNMKIHVMPLMLMTVCMVNRIEAGRFVSNGPNGDPILDATDPIIIVIVVIVVMVVMFAIVVVEAVVDHVHPEDLLVVDHLYALKI